MSKSLTSWLDNKRFNPFREFVRMEDSFDRMFKDVMNQNGTQDLALTPICEASEEGNNYVLKFDLPGVQKDHVKVTVDNDIITVQAERKEEKKQEDKKKYLSEVYYGSYLRSFTLPGPVDDKKIDAKFDNGVLTVKIPKTEASKAKQITVS